MGLLSKVYAHAAAPPAAPPPPPAFVPTPDPPAEVLFQGRPAFYAGRDAAGRNWYEATMDDAQGIPGRCLVSESFMADHYCF